MRSTIRILVLLCWGVLLPACSDDDSPEAQIRSYIAAGVEAAESRSSSDLAEMIDTAYLDRRGYNKKQLTSLMRAYFFRHKNIHLFTRIEQIELLAENQAQVRMHVAMAGSVIAGVDALSALRARIYTFDLMLAKQDEWQLRQASWQPASISDLQ